MLLPPPASPLAPAPLLLAGAASFPEAGAPPALPPGPQSLGLLPGLAETGSHSSSIFKSIGSSSSTAAAAVAGPTLAHTNANTAVARANNACKRETPMSSPLDSDVQERSMEYSGYAIWLPGSCYGSYYSSMI